MLLVATSQYFLVLLLCTVNKYICIMYILLILVDMSLSNLCNDNSLIEAIVYCIYNIAYFWIFLSNLLYYKFFYRKYPPFGPVFTAECWPREGARVSYIVSDKFKVFTQIGFATSHGGTVGQSLSHSDSRDQEWKWFPWFESYIS